MKFKKIDSAPFKHLAEKNGVTDQVYKTFWKTDTDIGPIFVGQCLDGSGWNAVHEDYACWGGNRIMAAEGVFHHVTAERAHDALPQEEKDAIIIRAIKKCIERSRNPAQRDVEEFTKYVVNCGPTRALHHYAYSVVGSEFTIELCDEAENELDKHGVSGMREWIPAVRRSFEERILHTMERLNSLSDIERAQRAAEAKSLRGLSGLILNIESELKKG